MLILPIGLLLTLTQNFPVVSSLRNAPVLPKFGGGGRGIPSLSSSLLIAAVCFLIRRCMLKILSKRLGQSGTRRGKRCRQSISRQDKYGSHTFEREIEKAENAEWFALLATESKQACLQLVPRLHNWGDNKPRLCHESRIC